MPGGAGQSCCCVESDHSVLLVLVRTGSAFVVVIVVAVLVVVFVVIVWNVNGFGLLEDLVCDILGAYSGEGSVIGCGWVWVFLTGLVELVDHRTPSLCGHDGFFLALRRVSMVCVYVCVCEVDVCEEEKRKT